MWRQRLNVLLHRFRLPISCLFFGAIVYYFLVSWLIIPPFALNIAWQNDTQLVILDTIVGEEYAAQMQPGDVILSIDNRPARRGELLFTYPVQSSYQVELLRDGELWVENVPFVTSDYRVNTWLGSITLLALAFWLIGTLIVWFSFSDQLLALYAGFSIQLISAGIASGGPTQLGIPGGWIVGHVLIFLFPTILIYLSLLPRQKNVFTLVETRLLQVVLFLSSVGMIISAIEALVLFPNTNLKQWSGIDRFSFLITLTGISALAALFVLIYRFGQTAKGSYERRQLLILFTFFSLGITPLLFAIFPITEILVVPFPLIYSFLLLIPIGYFYVLHRQGHLMLDTIASRIITFIFLVFAFRMAYITGRYFVDVVVQWEMGEVVQSGLVLIIAIAGILSYQPIQTLTEALLYSVEPLSDKSWQNLLVKISQNPDSATLRVIIQEIAVRLNCQHIAILVETNGCYKQLVATSSTVVKTIINTPALNRLYHSPSLHEVPDFPLWVKLSIPIEFPQEQLGLFLLSEPKQSYFDARQIKMLQDIAGIIAYGLQTITLLDVIQSLSKQMMMEKMLQRQQIATEIHNIPLQTLSHLMTQIQYDVSNFELENMSRSLRQVSKELRNIITDLRPSALLKSPEWMVKQLVRNFSERFDEINVSITIDIENETPFRQEARYALFNVLSEALNNVEKHSGASTVSVFLFQKEDQLCLTVADNGVGIDEPTKPLNELLRAQSFGMTDMYWWSSIAEGDLVIESNRPQGTRIRLALPLTTVRHRFMRNID
jgi:signal transduction histidine kinase